MGKTDKRKNLILNGLGYSLIEIMIVISIIAILSAVAYATYGKSQAGARDARRKQDIQSIQTALILYKQVNGSYPPPWYTPQVANAYPAFSTSSDPNAGHSPWIMGLGSSYFRSLPVDPINDRFSPYTYNYIPGPPNCDNPQSFVLYANTESGLSNVSQVPFISCNNVTGAIQTNAFEVRSPR